MRSPFGAGQHRHFGGGDRAALVVVGVDAERGPFHRWIASHECFDHVGVLVGWPALHRLRQVQNELLLAAARPRLFDGGGEVDDETEAAVAELFRREFIGDAAAESGGFHCVADLPGALDRHVGEFLFTLVEDEAAVEFGGGGVAVDRRPVRAPD